MSAEDQLKKEYDEAYRNIAEFMDALEHGEHGTREKMLSDKKELPVEQANTNEAPVESGTSILQMNTPSGGLSPLQAVQASLTNINPIMLSMQSPAMGAILQPDGSYQVPKSDQQHNNGPARLLSTSSPQGRKIHNFDLNQFPHTSLYDPCYEAIGLPVDPILRMFVLSKGWHVP